MTSNLLERRILEIVKHQRNVHGGHFDFPFFLVDLGKVKQQYLKWKTLMPRVEIFYAVKSCGEIPILKLLAQLGASFDCASKTEIETILNLGVAPSRIIFANTTKSTNSLQYSTENNVKLMVFDNEEELTKIREYSPKAELLLRISCRASSQVFYNFGMKYGCPLKKVEDLLKKARQKDLNVVGICFHIGGFVSDASVYRAAIEDAHAAFEIGKKTGFNFTVLDIGGGYPGFDAVPLPFEMIAKEMTTVLDEHFPADSGIRIIAEPGQYLVTSGSTLVLQVIGKRSNETLEKGVVNCDGEEKLVSPRFLYYLNDGIHGCASLPYKPFQVVKHLAEKNTESTYPSVLFGPTCDSRDVIQADITLPELQIGDCLYVENSGAYSISLARNFNSMPRAVVFYVDDETNAEFTSKISFDHDDVKH